MDKARIITIYATLTKMEVKLNLGEENITEISRKRNIEMTDELAVKKAIFNMGGTKLAGQFLQVSTSTIGKWARNGVIPNLERAKLVAQESGFSLASLRPRFEQKAN